VRSWHPTSSAVAASAEQNMQDAHGAAMDVEAELQAEAVDSACLSADWGLRLSVLEGVCLFWLAASRGANGTTSADHARGSSGGPPDGSAAEEVVLLLEQKVEDHIQEVRCPLHRS
jgi:hypothetical protein